MLWETVVAEGQVGRKANFLHGAQYAILIRYHQLDPGQKCRKILAKHDFKGLGTCHNRISRSFSKFKDGGHFVADKVNSVGDRA